MSRNFLFILFVSIFSFGFIKPGLLKKIKRCHIQLDQYEIIPGNLVEIKIVTTLNDSTIIESTNSNIAINFADYNFEFEGGVSVFKKSRTKLTLKISDEAFTNPYVKLSIRLRRKPTIAWNVELPILYDAVQKVNFSGESGYDPRATTDNGYRSIALTERINIQFIDEEKTLTSNSDPAIIGGKGPDLEVYVSLFRAENEEQYLRVEVKNKGSKPIVKYLILGIGSIEIISSGGKGGISKYGGRGGNGGDVTVYIEPKAKPYFKQVFIINEGGDGGDLWRPKVDGPQRGPYGDNGNLTIKKWEK